MQDAIIRTNGNDEVGALGNEPTDDSLRPDIYSSVNRNTNLSPSLPSPGADVITDFFSGDTIQRPQGLSKTDVSIQAVGSDVWLTYKLEGFASTTKILNTTIASVNAALTDPLP